MVETSLPKENQKRGKLFSGMQRVLCLHVYTEKLLDGMPDELVTPPCTQSVCSALQTKYALCLTCMQIAALE
ncbi:Hypothetical predicted protein [Podarcis lilfordi]|uniref:Uncharacterized protein n=1 Tax=Podarcis lilfordi TaxID=74358 RepID=A0AA35KFC1_9SAUR|nr:Hypothetical predicted protein [Podarcis lilfordi]